MPMPGFASRPYGPSLRGRRRRLASPVTMAAFMARAIQAVNARGLCAADVARLARLPRSEIRAMASRCGCRGCFTARAN